MKMLPDLTLYKAGNANPQQMVRTPPDKPGSAAESKKDDINKKFVLIRLDIRLENILNTIYISS
jgi:hypothetical protein